jgi:hypothetical protein
MRQLYGYAIVSVLRPAEIRQITTFHQIDRRHLLRLHALGRILIVMAHAGHELIVIVIATLLHAITQCISTFQTSDMDGETRLGHT